MEIGVLFLLIALALGLVLGWAIGFFTADRSGGSAEVKAKAAAHDALKSDVSDHLKQSARLMDELSDNYRKVYEHLAIGSQRLTGEALSPPESAPHLEHKVEAQAGAAAATQDDPENADVLDAEVIEPEEATAAEPKPEPPRRPD